MALQEKENYPQKTSVTKAEFSCTVLNVKDSAS